MTWREFNSKINYLYGM